MSQPVETELPIDHNFIISRSHNKNKLFQYKYLITVANENHLFDKKSL